MSYTDDIQVKIYKMLRVYDCNPYYTGTHGDVVADGESYCVIRPNTQAASKTYLYHMIEIPMITKFLKVENSEGQTITNLAEHLEYRQLVREAFLVDKDDLVKHQLLGDNKSPEFKGEIGTIIHDTGAKDTWNSTFLFKVFDIGRNL